VSFEALIAPAHDPPQTLTRHLLEDAHAKVEEGMPPGYLPIFIFLVLSILFPIAALLAGKLIRPSAPSRVKLEAYECGIEAASNSRGRYTVRFYIVAILFVIFDVEAVFLFPWAVRYKQMGWFGVAEVTLFLVILFVGYIWAYRKGALKWT
jgi:NADH-quinone oxidoreductase subunit A